MNFVLIQHVASLQLLGIVSDCYQGTWVNIRIETVGLVDAKLNFVLQNDSRSESNNFKYFLPLWDMFVQIRSHTSNHRLFPIQIGLFVSVLFIHIRVDRLCIVTILLRCNHKIWLSYVRSCEDDWKLSRFGNTQFLHDRFVGAPKELREFSECFERFSTKHGIRIGL